MDKCGETEGFSKPILILDPVLEDRAFLARKLRTGWLRFDICGEVRRWWWSGVAGWLAWLARLGWREAPGPTLTLEMATLTTKEGCMV